MGGVAALALIAMAAYYFKTRGSSSAASRDAPFAKRAAAMSTAPATSFGVGGGGEAQQPAPAEAGAVNATPAHRRLTVMPQQQQQGGAASRTLVSKGTLTATVLPSQSSSATPASDLVFPAPLHVTTTAATASTAAAAGHRQPSPSFRSTGSRLRPSAPEVRLMDSGASSATLDPEAEPLVGAAAAAAMSVGSGGGSPRPRSAPRVLGTAPSAGGRSMATRWVAPNTQPWHVALGGPRP